MLAGVCTCKTPEKIKTSSPKYGKIQNIKENTTFKKEEITESMSKMSDKSHEESLKLRTEVKEYIDRMVASGIPVTKKAVMEGAKVSNGFVNNKEITEYINKAKEKQAEQDLRVDVSLQNIILFRKLMSSYIFQYALLDEEEAFLKEAIKKMKEKLADNENIE